VQAHTHTPTHTHAYLHTHHALFISARDHSTPQRLLGGIDISHGSKQTPLVCLCVGVYMCAKTPWLDSIYAFAPSTLKVFSCPETPVAGSKLLTKSTGSGSAAVVRIKHLDFHIAVIGDVEDVSKTLRGCDFVTLATASCSVTP